MKINIVLALIAVLLGYATCKTFKNEPVATVEQAPLVTPPQKAEAPASNWRAAHVLSSNPDEAPPVQIRKAPEHVNVPIASVPPPNSSRRAFLATGYWHCAMALSGTDSLIHLEYQPKWMRFREDQTFDVIVKGQVVDNTGRWAFDEEKHEIYLSCKDPYLNNVWNVQEKGFVMVLKGNTSLNFTGIQIRVIGSKTQPKWD